MQAIAAHLKLSRSSVYFTFRAKSALFVQALRRYQAEGRAPGLSELRGAVSPRAALVRVFEVSGPGGEERQPRALYLLIETARGLKHREPEIARLVEETIEDLEVRFRGAIERGKAAAEIADRVDPVAVALGRSRSSRRHLEPLSSSVAGTPPPVRGRRSVSVTSGWEIIGGSTVGAALHHEDAVDPAPGSRGGWGITTRSPVGRLAALANSAPLQRPVRCCCNAREG